ncbi:hypothetical protein [Streptomyces atrovirens]|uniref:Uncharacterized protein n=1 Tax=Streptomyces atrovirens TaxID=285556 RepID=A0ABW0DTW4_9ACTN
MSSTEASTSARPRTQTDAGLEGDWPATGTRRHHLKGAPSITDFDHLKSVMVKPSSGDGLWQASGVFVETKAARCQ